MRTLTNSELAGAHHMRVRVALLSCALYGAAMAWEGVALAAAAALLWACALSVCSRIARGSRQFAATVGVASAVAFGAWWHTHTLLHDPGSAHRGATLMLVAVAFAAIAAHAIDEVREPSAVARRVRSEIRFEDTAPLLARLPQAGVIAGTLTGVLT